MDGWTQTDVALRINGANFDPLHVVHVCGVGLRAHADILRLVATLLVLQLMRVEKMEEGKLLRTLFCLDDSSQPRSV